MLLAQRFRCRNPTFGFGPRVVESDMLPIVIGQVAASSDMVIQSMAAAGHSLPRATLGVMTLAAVAVINVRRLIIGMTNLPDLTKLVSALAPMRPQEAAARER